MPPRILLVSHGAAQTGAIVLLLHFARWLRSQHYDVASILMNGGSLAAEFNKIGPSLVLRYPAGASNTEPNASTLKSIKRSLRNRFDNFRVDRFVKRFAPNTYYLNTLACWEAAKRLPKLGIPSILHVHELDEVIDEYCGVENVKQLLSQSSRIIACASAVADNLQRRFKIDVPTDVVHGFVDATRFSAIEKSPESVDQFRTRFGIPKGSFVVGSMGPVSSRKGTDLFVQVAIQCLRQSDRCMHFVWVGSQQEKGILRCMKRDLEKAGTLNRVHFVDHLSDPTVFLAAIDIFALTSREDPFPLSVLEAASLGRPSICFDAAGGMPSFSKEGRGLIVPYLDLFAFCQAILELSKNCELRQRLGLNGALAVQAAFNPDACCRAIMSVIQNELNDAI